MGGRGGAGGRGGSRGGGGGRGGKGGRDNSNDGQGGDGTKRGSTSSFANGGRGGARSGGLGALTAPKAKANRTGRDGILKFDPQARAEYVSGFRKRKLERQKKGAELVKERARLDRIEARKQRRKVMESKEDEEKEVEALHHARLPDYDDDDDELGLPNAKKRKKHAMKGADDDGVEMTVPQPQASTAQFDFVDTLVTVVTKPLSTGDENEDEIATAAATKTTAIAMKKSSGNGEHKDSGDASDIDNDDGADPSPTADEVAAADKDRESKSSYDVNAPAPMGIRKGRGKATNRVGIKRALDPETVRVKAPHKSKKQREMEELRKKQQKKAGKKKDKEYAATGIGSGRPATNEWKPKVKAKLIPGTINF